MTDSTFVTPEEAPAGQAADGVETTEPTSTDVPVETNDSPAAEDLVDVDTDAENEDEDPADDEQADESADAAPTTRLEAEGDIAADYLEELLDIADLDGDIDTYVEGGRAHVSIVTESDELVGKKGEVLEALQELARLAVMTETDHRSRLMLDIAGHRERRKNELTVLAKDAIAEVKQTGEAARLAPMNPFERKIIHDIVAQAGLVSESEGVEPRRRVVILP